MTTKNKIIISILIILFISILLFVIKLQYDAINKFKVIGSSLVEMKQLQDNIVRNESKYVTEKQLKDFAKESNIDLAPIKKDLKELSAEIRGISKVVSITPGGSYTGLPSTGSTPRPQIPASPSKAKCPDGTKCPDEFGYLSATQKLELKEPLANDKSMPWGEVSFSAWRKNPWDYNVYSRRYTSVSVISMNEDERHFVHSKMYVEVNGKKEALPIAKAEFVEEYPESKFRFNPNLYLGVDAAFKLLPFEGEGIPNLTLSIFNYGKFKNKPDWTILNLGLGYAIDDKNSAISINPISYNIANHIPLVSNMYIGPSFNIGLNSSVYLGLGIHAGL
jgi:hypothetical protein